MQVDGTLILLYYLTGTVSPRYIFAWSYDHENQDLSIGFRRVSISWYTCSHMNGHTQGLVSDEGITTIIIFLLGIRIEWFDLYQTISTWRKLCGCNLCHSWSVF